MNSSPPNNGISAALAGNSNISGVLLSSNNHTTPVTATTTTKPFVRIVEQPAKCAIRFRYECEGRSAGSIPGVNSTAENKSFPAIQVCNYEGKAVVVVSCVTRDSPYRPHPHNLVGKEGCKKGVCTLVIDPNSSDMTCTFTSLGIQCVKRKDIEESLKLRELIKVDPYRTGFNHRSQASSIDLNVVRLCFQVFVEGPEKGKFTVQLPPVVSDPIFDKKAMAELIITKMSHYSAPVTGGKEIILLCDRVAKDDIQVRFFHESLENCSGMQWEAYGDFLPNDVHKQVAIALRTPKYYDETIQQPITVQIQLRRPSDGCTSLSRSFQLTPRELDPDGMLRKRHKRLKEENYDLLQEYIQMATGQQSSGQVQSTTISVSGPAAAAAKRSIGGAAVAASSSSPTKKDLINRLQHQQQQHLQHQASTSAAAAAAVSPSSRSSSMFAPLQQQQQQQQQQQAQQNILCTNDNGCGSPSRSSQPSSPFANNNHNNNNNNNQNNINNNQNNNNNTMMYNQNNNQQNEISNDAISSSPVHVRSNSPASSNIQQQQQHQHQHQHHHHLQQQQGFSMISSRCSPNNASYQMYQQAQPSPNPSIASFSSNVSSPMPQYMDQSNNNNNPSNNPSNNPNNNPSNNNNNALPSEVMQRFDSLDIDSSELIPDLEFNSNTMLNLIMDTSSGLSLTDSFSDITNGNDVVRNDKMATAATMTRSYNNGDNNGLLQARNRNSKLRLQVMGGGSSPAISSSTSSTNLDTPTIEMINSGDQFIMSTSAFGETNDNNGEIQAIISRAMATPTIPIITGTNHHHHHHQQQQQQQQQAIDASLLNMLDVDNNNLII